MYDFRFEKPSTLIRLFMGHFDYELYMCDVNDTDKEVDLSDGIIETSSEI